MMNTQPEALRLADLLEGWTITEDEAADELRRLHEVNQELLAVCNKIKNHGTISSVWFDDLEAAITKATNQ